MIVATAGHIDHGKTTLVKALTGVDTSRLPEEKARGITIDIGFAYWRPPGDDATVGFVDVPGHEHFVHNMLAGVCGVDYVMLLVAADDGVMPQTIEHLNIVDLLGVSRGVVVITKTDRVSDERISEVAVSVRGLLDRTSLAGTDVHKVSAVSGDGIPALAKAIAAAARHGRPSRLGRRFRFAIDRVFTIAGSGTVVTGTVFDGQINVGDRFVLSPGGTDVRVRGIQQNGHATSLAQAGERCAINLSGVEVSGVRRGDWVLDPLLHAPTHRIDVRLKLLATETDALRHWTPVHLHLAAEDLTARVAFRRGAVIQPGHTATAQLITDRPLAALHGDRFIIRDQSALRTLGGGIVIDPFPPRRRINPALRAAQLAALDTDDAGTALRALQACTPSGVDLSQFERSFNLRADDLAELVKQNGLVAIGKEPPVALPLHWVDEIKQRVVDTLERFHAESPREPGMEIAALRSKCAPSLSLINFQVLLRSLVDEKRIAISGSVARIARHDATDNREDQLIWSVVEPVLETSAFNGVTVSELASTTGIAEKELTDFLHRKSRTGEVIRVTTDRFYMRRTLAQFATVAAEAARATLDGKFTVASIRDRSGVGRARAVQMLECLDRLRITKRIGDVRVLSDRSL